MAEAKKKVEQEAKVEQDPAAIFAEMAAKIEELTKTVETLKAAPTAPAEAPKKALFGPIPPEVARKQVLARRSKEPKTYRALMDGTDLKQGYVKAGTVFSTCQPQGSWMELVEDEG